MLLNILIIEKEQVIALDLKQMLEDIGYNVIGIISSGEEALKIVKNNKIDLIFTAMNLNGALDGIETILQIRTISNTPVIYTTANSDLTKREEIKQTMPYQYLIKPFDNSQIQTAVNNCLIAIKLNEIQKDSIKQNRNIPDVH